MRWILLLLLMTSTAYASEVVCFSPGNQVSFYHKSAHTPDFAGNPNCEINPDLSSVTGVPRKYWKKNLFGSIVEMSQAEKDAVDAPEVEQAQKVAELTQIRQDLEALPDTWDAMTPPQQFEAHKLLWRKEKLEQELGGIII